MPTDPAPRPELLALLDAIKDNPDEDTPRLVLADWLDEQDNSLDAQRAKFIREHIAQWREQGVRATLLFGDPTCAALAQAWLGPVADLGGRFIRGLPMLTCYAPQLLASD